MAKAKIKALFEVDEKKDGKIREAVNKKFFDKVIEYPAVPRIGKWIDLIELSPYYDFTEEELKWLSEHEHKYRIENVNKCDGYMEAELDMDKIWPDQA